MSGNDEPSLVLYLVDGSSYLYRSFYAVKGLRNKEGLPTNAVFGFLNMILKILKAKSPSHMAVAFDTRTPTFRHERYPEYKAHRDKLPEELEIQIPYIKEALRLLGVPILEMEGFEADDILGTLARETADSGGEAVLVASDKDFFQLLSDGIRMWDTMKDTEIAPEHIRERFGVEPSRVLEVMGLMGDASDNIPGVPGVGEKTAVKLIQEYGSIERILERRHEITQAKLRENLEKYGDQALTAMELMVIRTDVPLGVSAHELELRPPDRAALREFYRTLDFKKLAEELGGEEEESARDAPKTYAPITRWEDLVELVKRLERAEVFALDTETTSPEPTRARLVGISFSLAPHEAYYVPLAHSILCAPEQIEERRALEALRPVLESSHPLKVGHNIKYDLIVLRRHGIALEGVAFDTMVGSYLLDPERHGHSLANVAWEFLGERTTTYKEVTGTGKSEVTFDLVPLDKACRYAAEDADVCFRLYRLLENELGVKSLQRLMERVEVPLISVLATMEMHGVKVDRRVLEDMSQEIALQLVEFEERIYKLAGRRFNLNSPRQLGAVLFEEMGLPPMKKTAKKSGFSTDMEVLAVLARSEPIAMDLLNYRLLTKLKSTYVDTLPLLIHPETGRVHTSFNQTVTATGRLSSSNPNLQNIPARGEEGRRIRGAFAPENGFKLVSADYSQIELRILAHYSEDPALTEAFRRGEDIHSQTACGLFGVLPEQVSSDMRRQAKVVNFGIIYGMSAYGLSRQLGVSRQEAQEIIDRYFLRFAGVRSFIEGNLEEARKREYVTTILDRRRYLPQIRSRNKIQRSNAERIATNTPFQGSAADIIKVAMIRLHTLLKERSSRTRMILQVHDELVFEAPEQELEGVMDMIRGEMETAVPLKVPLVVDVRSGDNWAEAH